MGRSLNPRRGLPRPDSPLLGSVALPAPPRTGKPVSQPEGAVPLSSSPLIPTGPFTVSYIMSTLLIKGQVWNWRCGTGTCCRLVNGWRRARQKERPGYELRQPENMVVIRYELIVSCSVSTTLSWQKFGNGFRTLYGARYDHLSDVAPHRASTAEVHSGFSPWTLEIARIGRVARLYWFASLR